MMSRRSWKQTCVKGRDRDTSAKMKSFCLKHTRLDSPVARTVWDLDFQFLALHSSFLKFTYFIERVLRHVHGVVSIAKDKLPKAFEKRKSWQIS